MEIYHSFSEIQREKPFVCAIGFFDGFHLGHRAILEAARNLAKEKDAEWGIITFDPHPEAVLFPQKKMQYLETLPEKLSEAERLSARFAVICPVTEEFLHESADTFLQCLSALPKLTGMVCGENFTFGRNAEGKPDAMRAFLAEKGISVSVLPLMTSEEIGGRPISSTEIRALLLEGDVSKAAALLGRFYRLSGDVAHGFRRGTEAVGYPTANLSFDETRILPADGVYATVVEIRGEKFPAVTNIGKNPTFGNQNRTVETFILDFDETIYGESFSVSFVGRIRGEKKFENAAALSGQIENDIEAAREILCRDEYFRKTEKMI